MMIPLVMIASHVELSAVHAPLRLIRVLIASTFRIEKYQKISAYVSMHSLMMEL